MNQQYNRLLNLTVRFLGFRPRSKQEVVTYLQKKTSDPQLTDQLVNRLTELKLIDDGAFAKWYVESRSRSRPRSTRLLALELRRKGIDSVTMSDPVTISDVDLATQALQKKKSLKSREQAIRFLYSRGFTWDVIEKTLKTAYNDNDVN